MNAILSRHRFFEVSKAQEWPFGTCFHHGCTNSRNWSSASLNHFHCGRDAANAGDLCHKESLNHFQWRRKGATAEEDPFCHKINRILARLQFLLLLVTFFWTVIFPLTLFGQHRKLQLLQLPKPNATEWQRWWWMRTKKLSVWNTQGINMNWLPACKQTEKTDEQANEQAIKQASKYSKQTRTLWLNHAKPLGWTSSLDLQAYPRWDGEIFFSIKGFVPWTPW